MIFTTTKKSWEEEEKRKAPSSSKDLRNIHLFAVCALCIEMNFQKIVIYKRVRNLNVHQKFDYIKCDIVL